MRGGGLAEAMAAAMDSLVNAREGSSRLDKTIETIVDTTRRFNRRDATNFLETYKAKILMCDYGYSRGQAVVHIFPSFHAGIHVEVLEI